MVRAIAAQAAALLFYSTAVPHPLREQLAERLASLCPDPLERVFFCNSGAEANENALHLARKATGRQGVVSVTGGWHGRTVGDPGLHRRRPLRGGGGEERHSALHPGAGGRHARAGGGGR